MMGWREYAKEVQGGRDVRDNRDKSHEIRPTVPCVPNVPVVIAQNLIRDWAKSLSGLQPHQPLNGISLNRWVRFYDTSCWWLDHYGAQAARDGWSTGDVFGLHPGREGWSGLIDRLGNARNLVMEGGRARWRNVHGQPQQMNAGLYTGLKPFWEVGLF